MYVGGIDEAEEQAEAAWPGREVSRWPKHHGANEQLRCVVVTPERAVLDEPADFVALPMYDGELGVLPGRAPLIGRLGCGELRIRRGGQVAALLRRRRLRPGARQRRHRADRAGDARPRRSTPTAASPGSPGGPRRRSTPERQEAQLQGAGTQPRPVCGSPGNTASRRAWCETDSTRTIDSPLRDQHDQRVRRRRNSVSRPHHRPLVHPDDVQRRRQGRVDHAPPRPALRRRRDRRTAAARARR